MRKASLIIVLVLVMSMVLIACTPNENNVPNNQDVDVPSLEEQVRPDTDKDEEKPPNNEGDNEQVEEETKPTIEYDIIAVITANKVNIRAGMGSKYKVLGTMKRGEGLALVDDVISSWIKVHYKGKHAYISSSLVKFIYIPKSTNKTIELVIEVAKPLIGYPYIWGSQRYHWGNGIRNKNFVMGEFDCSALTQYAYHIGAGINIDVTTRGQVLQGNLVKDNIQRGDLMFFTNSTRRHKVGIERVGHVAVYLGDNYILHTAEGYAVIEEISKTRWSNYLVSRRFI